MIHSPLAGAKAVLCFLLALGMLGALGCGKGKAKVHGKVTLDGKDVSAGTISFFPVDGKGQTAAGIIKDGSYTAEVPPGSMRVEIRAPKVTGKRPSFNAPNSPTQDTFEETIPAKFNIESKLVREIKAGSPVENFELKSTE